ncbi:alpha-amylase family glycosyl hydrolase [Halosolutus amylolyticus]|uniref:Alpha-amylase family glycosyl hydrolase n=1 Tax=Halosolutus amylolyticus TaxID=2932267 RepID=A0ABD5PQC3_9EURY|nr:alpha-amylase family glycosyl hydrolase [Halosolutus amylolyticus]
MNRRTFITTLAAATTASAFGTPASADHRTDAASIDLESGDGSHHPGPPRFLHANEAIADPLGHETETRDSLAPWNPDGDATYSWSIVDAPDGADPDLSGDDVVAFDPDEPGEYRLELEAPDGTHELTVRVYPDDTEDDPRPRVDLDAEVVGGQVLLNATASEPEREDVIGSDLDVEFVVDDRHRDRLGGLDGPISAADIDDRVRVHAVAVGTRHSVPDAIDLVPDGDSITVEHPYDVPDWAEDAVVYEIFTRRFPDQDDPTFDTIADRVAHMADLGVDAVWMTPFVETDRGFGTPPEEGGPHGYHTVDYFSTDPDLGTMEDFEALVEECHEHDIKVIFDLVINHTADSHPFFEAATDPDNPDHEKYVDWYRWTDRDALEAEFYFGWGGIPNLNYDNPEVRQFCLEVIDYWVEKVDGIRADVGWGVPKGFWQEMYDRIKRHDPEFLLLDETMPYDVEYAGGLFDVHYDNHLHAALGDAADGNPESILDAVERRRQEGAPDHALFLQYIENHDTDRFLASHDAESQRAAAAATFTLPGVPMLYYGQETGLYDWREAMNWGEFDEYVLDFYDRLVDLYHDHPAFGARGRLERIDYESEEDGALAYARYDPDTDRRAVVFLNFETGPQTITVGDYVHEENLLSDSPANIEYDEETGTAAVTVGTAVVLEADEPEEFVLSSDALVEWPSEEGTDHGPGSYTYPETDEIPEGEFDLASVTIEEGDGHYRIAYEFQNELSDPWNGPLGFSHPMMQVYFRNPDGEAGTTEARTGVNAEFEAAYHHRVVADGFVDEFQPRVEDAEGTHVSDVELHYDRTQDPRTIRMTVPDDGLDYLPEGEGMALVFSMDGYGEGRIRQVGTDGGDWSFGGANGSDAPNVIDMVTPGNIDQSEALAHSVDEVATIPFAPIGDDVATDPDEETADETDEGSSAIPGFGVAAGAAGVAGGAAYAASNALGDADESDADGSDAADETE